MSFFSKLFDELEHDAKPLLSAAAAFAEKEGLEIVRQVRQEIETAGPSGLVTLFNRYVAPSLGVAPVTTGLLSDVARDLLSTVMARAKAVEEFGTHLRASVLNAGIEQAVLLAKGTIGDVKTAPPKGVMPLPTTISV